MKYEDRTYITLNQSGLLGGVISCIVAFGLGHFLHPYLAAGIGIAVSWTVTFTLRITDHVWTPAHERLKKLRIERANLQKEMDELVERYSEVEARHLRKRKALGRVKWN